MTAYGLVQAPEERPRRVRLMSKFNRFFGRRSGPAEHGRDAESSGRSDAPAAPPSAAEPQAAAESQAPVESPATAEPQAAAESQVTAEGQAAGEPQATAEPQAPPESRPPPSSPELGTTIGPSIKLAGEVTGDGDVVIEGRVEGCVEVGPHAVTVGRDGHIEGNILAGSVTVAGTVRGDVRARGEIVLLASADMDGDLASPSVRIRAGALFRGAVDMRDAPGRPGSEAPGESAGQSAEPDLFVEEGETDAVDVAWDQEAVDVPRKDD